MSSNELRKCNKLLKRAKTDYDVFKAVWDLSAEKNTNKQIMKEMDWVRLVSSIIKAKNRVVKYERLIHSEVHSNV